MPNKEILDYFNDLLSRMEALFYHEITGTAVKKVDVVGIDLLQSRNIQGKTAEEVIENCIR